MSTVEFVSPKPRLPTVVQQKLIKHGSPTAKLSRAVRRKIKKAKLILKANRMIQKLKTSVQNSDYKGIGDITNDILRTVTILRRRYPDIAKTLSILLRRYQFAKCDC
jgi:hypothetical protein